MKALWMTLLIASSVILIGVLIRNRMSWGWLRYFAIHMVAAAGALYLLNYSGLIPGMYIPLNPFSVGAVVVLGLPGVALMAGLQWVIA
ncbi:pro-sigmaK processing inhibitor BofA family protein [Paenibacillus sp. CAU 1782]